MHSVLIIFLSAPRAKLLFKHCGGLYNWTICYATLSRHSLKTIAAIEILTWPKQRYSDRQKRSWAAFELMEVVGGVENEISDLLMGNLSDLLSWGILEHGRSTTNCWNKIWKELKLKLSTEDRLWSCWVKVEKKRNKKRKKKRIKLIIKNKIDQL